MPRKQDSSRSASSTPPEPSQRGRRKRQSRSSPATTPESPPRKTRRGASTPDSPQRSSSRSRSSTRGSKASPSPLASLSPRGRGSRSRRGSTDSSASSIGNTSVASTSTPTTRRSRRGSNSSDASCLSEITTASTTSSRGGRKRRKSPSPPNDPTTKTNGASPELSPKRLFKRKRGSTTNDVSPSNGRSSSRRTRGQNAASKVFSPGDVEERSEDSPGDLKESQEESEVIPPENDLEERTEDSEVNPPENDLDDSAQIVKSDINGGEVHAQLKKSSKGTEDVKATQNSISDADVSHKEKSSSRSTDADVSPKGKSSSKSTDADVSLKGKSSSRSTGASPKGKSSSRSTDAEMSHNGKASSRSTDTSKKCSKVAKKSEIQTHKETDLHNSNDDCSSPKESVMKRQLSDSESSCLESPEMKITHQQKKIRTDNIPAVVDDSETIKLDKVSSQGSTNNDKLNNKDSVTNVPTEMDSDTCSVAETFLKTLGLNVEQITEVNSSLSAEVKDSSVDEVVETLVEQLLTDTTTVKTMNAPRFNKFLRQLLTHYCSLETTRQSKHSLCEKAVEWARERKSVNLRHELELTLMSLYYSTKHYKKAETIANALYSETKKLQDKEKTVKACLCLSQVYHAMGNISKARANITTAKTEALKIYAPPDMQGELDLQSGIMQVAEGKDMETAFSYFKEAATGFTSRKQRSRALKYMLLTKVMVNRSEEGEKAVKSQSHVQDIDEGVEAMLAITSAANKSSLADFKKTREQYKNLLEGDIVVASVLDDLYTSMMEKNLLNIVLPYERLQILYVAEKIGLPREEVERRLSQMILDKRINAQLDHRDDCLYVYGAEEKDAVYQTSIDSLAQLDKTVSHLNRKVKRLL